MRDEYSLLKQKDAQIDKKLDEIKQREAKLKAKEEALKEKENRTLEFKVRLSYNSAIRQS